MHKKHIFLRVVSKITIFACVFCAVPAWSDTTTCDIDFTPVTGNSWQNGTPTPTNPVAIESVGTKVGNKYQIPVTVSGKNLFDGGERGSYDSTTGEKVLNNNKFRSKNKIPVIAGQTYSNNIINKPSWLTVSTLNIYGYDAQGAFLWSGTTSLNAWSIGRSFTMPENTTYITISTFGTDVNTDERVTELNEKFMIVEGSTAPASYEPYSAPITTPIYLNAPLRKVGDYADVLDYKNGTITRNVGIKVLDGTESWTYIASVPRFTMVLDGSIKADNQSIPLCSHYIGYRTGGSISASKGCGVYSGGGIYGTLLIKDTDYTTLEDFKSYLAAEYAAGTPVTIYYPLATPVVEQIENWSCTPPITNIKIATTKMVDEEFAAAEAKLATTVQTIESVVSRTIAQTGQIQVLQDTKQTRPDESCPANMKCLLVQDEDGTPHWYPIIEP